MAVPKSIHSRWSKLRQVTVERGFAQVAPRVEDTCTPTFIPRRTGASSTQIDGLFAARCHITPMQVERESRQEVGTDHERVSARVMIRKDRRRDMSAKHRAGGPRRVDALPSPQEEINETILQQLAERHTKPASLGPGFRISTATKVLQKQARRTKTAEAWQLYLASLRKEKDEWKSNRVNRASQDWGTYKQLCRKKTNWAEGYMMASQSETPERDVVQYFTEVFHDAEQPETIVQLCRIADTVQAETIVPFSPEEVRAAFLEGKKCKAVGPDGVPLELLLVLMQDECTLQSFVAYFNPILSTGQTPQDWNTSVATLLPKLPQPVQAKQLRPIALASHTSKAFSRLLLQRVGKCLMPTGPKQLACRGRQPTDLVWSSLRVVHLAREWGVEMHMIKLDLRRAFDSVYRVKLAERVQEWCQLEFAVETRCLIRLLAAADLVLTLPWGCYDVHSNTGVKQGATESPLLFGRLVDEILGDIPFNPQHAVFHDMTADGGCYMDDVIAWVKTVPALQQFLDALLPRLAAFGLFVQPPKCQLLSTRSGPDVVVTIEGMQLHPVACGERIVIMNLPVGFAATDRHVMEHLVDKARVKFHSISHILCSRVPLRYRLKLLKTVVFGSCLG